VEYKSAKDGFPNSFWETYSAFGNTNGGVIVLGVKEKKNQILVEGLEDATVDKYKKEFWNAANNRQKVQEIMPVEPITLCLPMVMQEHTVVFL
jgi:predicted HTH transcriptional regulator